jgi:hypothetical protein
MRLGGVQVAASLIQARFGNGRGSEIGIAGDLRGSAGQAAHFAMADIGMAAFSPFFMQSPSFLATWRTWSNRSS